MHGHSGQLEVGSTNAINLCLILSTIYIFIPVSDCVGRVLSALFCPGAYHAVNTALFIGLIKHVLTSSKGYNYALLISHFYITVGQKVKKCTVH